MSLIPKDEAELIRLKMQMEVIRTVCPMLMILIQLFIIIHIYQARIMPTINADENHSHLACSTWNTPGQKFLEKKLDFLKFLARGRQQQVNDYFQLSPIQFRANLVGKGQSFMTKSARGRQQQSDETNVGGTCADYTVPKRTCQVFFSGLVHLV